MSTRAKVKQAERQREMALRCPICWDDLSNPSITPCGHQFCDGCIRHALRLKHECPTCREPLTHRSLRPAGEPEEAEDLLSWQSRARARALVAESEAAAAADGTWECAACTLRNPAEVDRCSACTTQRPPRPEKAAAAKAKAAERASRAPAAAAAAPGELPPGWRRRTDFGRARGYVGPDGRKAASPKAAWAVHKKAAAAEAEAAEAAVWPGGGGSPESAAARWAAVRARGGGGAAAGRAAGVRGRGG